MEQLTNKLIGELIGLARATDGNEHLISESSTSVILTCLNAQPSDEMELDRYLKQVEDAKREMVPDCFLCAAPCGRTSAYDLALIDRDPPDVRDVKRSILARLLSIAKGTFDPRSVDLLYRGLIALGLEGYSAEELKVIFPL